MKVAACWINLNHNFVLPVYVWTWFAVRQISGQTCRKEKNKWSIHRWMTGASWWPAGCNTCCITATSLVWLLQVITKLFLLRNYIWTVWNILSWSYASSKTSFSITTDDTSQNITMNTSHSFSCDESDTHAVRNVRDMLWWHARRSCHTCFPRPTKLTSMVLSSDPTLFLRPRFPVVQSE